MQPKARESSNDTPGLDGLTCRSCIHFDDDPAKIEADFPGIPVFGSAYSSARGHAGICRQLDRFLDPLHARDCPSFEALRECSESLSSTG